MTKPSHRTSVRTSGSQAHEQLLAAAGELFYREGIRGVGIDAVVARAGVNKMSLYRQFESKDALAIAYLERLDAQYWQRFEACVAAHPDAPGEQLLAFVAELLKRIAAPGYRGCPFINAALEFSDPDCAVRLLTRRHKEHLLERLTQLAHGAGAQQPQQLAGGLALLIEGCYTASQTYGAQHPMLQAAAQCAAHMVATATAEQA
jgi:AcrR family transcriptional regulator